VSKIVAHAVFCDSRVTVGATVALGSFSVDLSCLCFRVEVVFVFDFPVVCFVDLFFHSDISFFSLYFCGVGCYIFIYKKGAGQFVMHRYK